MSEAATAIAFLRPELQDEPSPAAALQRRNASLRAELDELEPVISASLLVTTAFRLRDQEGLLSALRMLVEATDGFDQRRARA
jgi:hypothetical protein